MNLRSVVTVFDEWAKRYADNGQGLLIALGMRAAEGASDDAWRVGVQTPKKGGAAAEAMSGGAKQGPPQTLSEVLRQRKMIQPAIMQVEGVLFVAVDYIF